jgi:hypothetical protein
MDRLHQRIAFGRDDGAAVDGFPGILGEPGTPNAGEG